ncbi:hypothetical protein BKA57DRAFT_226484 [Linnemannia elongata]|uniref:Uncharacterized protein n=1 Tax=Linnemannia elongata AG-77 TaxID=1314771 RepID=A0A197JJL8_9FUNG|nr:hypothetical protein BKA57DRAFT_226484 [Linnemannia elongata]OAQ25402.1 hypothetical protein K457DRAFT_141202 [Linnemannia elongata AG-77]
MDASNRTNEDNITQDTINNEEAQDNFDTSSFSAPLGAPPLPTFKPRKNNRVSVSYPPPTTSSPTGASESVSTGELLTAATSLPLAGGGPPGLIGSSRHGATPSPPPPAGGMKLPPPPMKGAGTGPSPIPYTKGDFRTAAIDNHWNDPPTKIFEKTAKKDDAAAYDFGPMNETLTRIIKECSAHVPAPQKRMFEDTTKRLQSLQEQMQNGTVKERVVVPLGEMIEALSSRSFAQCHAIHAKLMQTEFDSEGKWLLGFKRLIDLYITVPSS